MNKSKNVLFYIIGGCSIAAAVCIILLPIISLDFFGTHNFNLLYFYDKMDWDESFALIAIFTTVIALFSIVNSIFSFTKMKIPVVIFSGINLLGCIIYVISIFAAIEGHGAPGMGTILYSILSIVNLVLIIVQFQISKKTTESELYHTTDKLNDYMSSSSGYYEAENILISNAKESEKALKSDMPWDSNESVYDKTSSYFSDVKKEESFDGTDAFEYHKAEEDFVTEEKSEERSFELNDEFEAPPSFASIAEKVIKPKEPPLSEKRKLEIVSFGDKFKKNQIAETESILNDEDEFEAPPSFDRTIVKKVKPIEMPKDEDEFEAPPAFKIITANKPMSSSSKWTGTVSSKFKGSLTDKWK